MKIAISAKVQNGLLFEAVQKMGSVAALARHLGYSNSLVGDWLNFKRAPAFRKSAYAANYVELEQKLFALTGHLLEDIFPVEICDPQFLQLEKRRTQMVDMPVWQLAAMGAVPSLLPAPDAEVRRGEVANAIAAALTSLDNPRAEKLLKMRFGLDDGIEHTQDEVAAHFGVSGARVQQIEAKAMRMLRHPSRSRKLKRATIISEPNC